MNPMQSNGHRRLLSWATCALASLLLAACAPTQKLPATDAHLPSWNDGPSRTAIVEFVRTVTQPDSPDFVPAEDRIAVFDNDGTLWSEQPMYFEVLFSLERLKALAPEHPEWKVQQPFKAAIEGDHATLAQAGTPGLLQIVAATHGNTSTEDFTQSVTQWTATARHPRFNQPYTQMTFLPMRELLDYLRAHSFKTYIVSGGEAEFMRPWTQKAYGIPPEQVIGTSLVTTFEMRGAQPILWRAEKLEFTDDGPGKPVAIQRYIGRRPLLAFGNSDGDLQMLQWTSAGKGKRFAGLVHHTDAQREWAYDRDSHIGRLDHALDAARSNGWTVVDMKTEWIRIFEFEAR